MEMGHLHFRQKQFLGLFVLSLWLQLGSCHISSVLASDGKPVQVAGRPTVPSALAEDGLFDINAINYLKHPSFQHKFLNRMSQFHGNDRHYFGGSPLADRPVSSIVHMDDGTVSVEDDPTFAPFIGARALSNIPKFFEHLRANIEAMKENPDGTLDVEVNLPQRRMDSESELHDDDARDLHSEIMQWIPATPLHDRNVNLRTFVPPVGKHRLMGRATTYNPAWLYTNLGLGKRRRR